MSFVNDFIASLFATPGYNASYHLLAAAYLQILATSTRGPARALGWMDNTNPREAIAWMEKSGKVAPKVLDGLKRREAAHQNGWEMLPMCAAAVLAGNTAGLSARYMNTFMIAYIILRGVYIRLYVVTTSQNRSMARSLVWGACAMSIIWTLFKAGSKMNAGV